MQHTYRKYEKYLKVQLGNVNGRDHLGDTGNRQGDDIKTEFQETACNGVGWIYMEQQAFTDLIMKFQIPHEMGNFLTRTYSFIKEVNCVL
jgi:hypothetical protein